MAFDTSNIDRTYRAGHFGYLRGTVGTALWAFLTEADNILRLRTAASVGRPAVEGLSDALIAEFGHEINEPRVKQVIGHMVKQIMDALGYEVDRPRVRTRSGFFSTGMSFRPKLPPGPDLFNRWLDEQVRSPDGALDLEKIAHVAEQWGVSLSVKRRGVAMQRLELGVKLRPVVPPSDYEPAETGVDDEEARQRLREADQRRFPGIPDDPAEADAWIRQRSARRT
jgi:hypothetical protein